MVLRALRINDSDLEPWVLKTDRTDPLGLKEGHGDPLYPSGPNPSWLEVTFGGLCHAVDVHYLKKRLNEFHALTSA